MNTYTTHRSDLSPNVHKFDHLRSNLITLLKFSRVFLYTEQRDQSTESLPGKAFSSIKTALNIVVKSTMESTEKKE